MIRKARRRVLNDRYNAIKIGAQPCVECLALRIETKGRFLLSILHAQGQYPLCKIKARTQTMYSGMTLAVDELSLLINQRKGPIMLNGPACKETCTGERHALK
ncbi:MAG: hypothetical protein AUG75_09940 [Cyanobacteria bacterium 13_1_20CM_4_61_6]|nr:MAG: hypothetical protein AUG75_09940 [Cyanobacteria bacterium 13_1_20CM_4_61_6]